MISADALRKMIPDNLFAVMSDDELIISDRISEAHVDIRLEPIDLSLSDADFYEWIVRPALAALTSHRPSQH